MLHLPTHKISLLLKVLNIPKLAQSMFGKSKTPLEPDGTRRQISLVEAALNWQAENVMAQNQALSKILDNQQKLAEIVTHTFSSSGSLNDDLKKKNQDG